MNESYRKDDTKPFGCYVAYNHLKDLFDYRYFEIQEKRFDLAWDDIKYYSSNTKYSLYFIIAKNLEVDSSEAASMVEYVREGNDLFVAADYLDPDFLQQFRVDAYRWGEIMNEVNGKMNDTHVKMFFGDDFKSPAYSYYYYPFLNAFAGYDSSGTRVLGVNQEGKPDYIIMFVGKGRLYLHAGPRAFSNYFVLTGNNYQYLENALSYLRFDPKNIYWDEYYKTRMVSQSKKTGGNNSGGSEDDKEKFSSFDVIKKNPPLLWAFWLAVITLLLYILVNIKRKQRVINQVQPNTNATVTFTETVGRLYLQKKNNKNIAEKMITYFYEHIRNSYYLNTAQVNNDFISSLSRKSKVDMETTRQLFNLINGVGESRSISDVELLKLHELIQKFYKK